MQRGEIYLASFPYGEAPVMKLRPVLLLTGAVGVGTEVVVAYMSSVIPSPLLDTDLLVDPDLPEHKDTRLKTQSVLRLHKLATIHQTSLQRYVGKISASTSQWVETTLRRIFGI